MPKQQKADPVVPARKSARSAEKKVTVASATVAVVDTPAKEIAKATPKSKAKPKKTVVETSDTVTTTTTDVSASAATATAEAATTTTTTTKTVQRKSSKIKSDAPVHPDHQDDYPTPYGKIAGKHKIISWNVAGLNSMLQKSGLDYIKKEDPSVVCLQETKTNPEDDAKWKEKLGNWPYAYFSCSASKGRHGTAVLSRVKPVSVHYGLDDSGKHENDGRVIILEFKEFILVNTYVPNSGMKLENLDARIEWDKELRKRFKQLTNTLKKPIVWTGDLNVAHTDYDLATPDARRDKSPGATTRERESFDVTLGDANFVDVWRHSHQSPRAQHFTFWSYKFQQREKNSGWRLDYFLATQPFALKLGDAVFIRSKVVGSDHAPLGLLVDESSL